MMASPPPKRMKVGSSSQLHLQNQAVLSSTLQEEDENKVQEERDEIDLKKEGEEELKKEGVEDEVKQKKVEEEDERDLKKEGEEEQKKAGEEEQKKAGDEEQEIAGEKEVKKEGDEIMREKLQIELVEADTSTMTVQCYMKKRAPIGMVRGSATTDGQFGYFIPHNSSSLYQYEFITEKWETLPECPYHNSGLAIINNELNTVGGENSAGPTNKLMTLRQGVWVEDYPPMKTARSNPAVVTTSDGNYLIVIGGMVDFLVNGWSATVELLQLKTRVWCTAAELPKAFHLPSAAIVGGQLNVIGCRKDGFYCSLCLPSSKEPITSPVMLFWTTLPPLPVTRSTVASLCGQLVLIGGREEIRLVNSIYQLVNEHWMKVGSMTEQRERCLFVSPSLEKILIVGGYGAVLAFHKFGTMDIVDECVV